MARKKLESSARGKRVKKNAKRIAKSKEKIDFSDIPELDDEQLKIMRPVGRPPIGELTRQLIAIRIDPQVLEQLQKEAEKIGKGYQTLINEILADYIKQAS